AGEAGRLQKAVIAWFDRYLKRDTGVDTGARFEWIADDAKWRTADRFPPRTIALLSGDGAGTLPLAPTSDSGQPQIAATPAANAVNVAISEPQNDVLVLGAPKLELTYTGNGASTAPRDHVYAQIVDTKAGRVIGNQATPIPVTLDGAEHTITRPLEPLAAAATAASRYQLQIVASTGVYGPQRASGAITFSRVHVDLPVIDNRVVAGPGGGARLRVGSLRYRRTRARRLRVAVTATPASQVVVRVRDARGRLLGRSRATQVGRRTVVTVALKRRLRPGRYAIEATGSGLTAKRTVRLR
ncbi:MAG: type transport system ATP-binding protein, partial [Thermoleophilales bacterium]|nr:type transport system ATP-binding protein [Thermoleophilales bacterium]